jgi:hypothetical protein
VSDTNVDEISILKDFTKLQSLDICNTKISCLDNLVDLENIERIRLSKDSAVNLDSLPSKFRMKIVFDDDNELYF